MKDLRSAVPIYISIVFVYALVLTVAIVSHVYTDSSLEPQIVPASAGAVQDDPGLPIAAGTEVLIVYTITIPESNLTIPPHFSQFISGHHELLPNLEKAITGMKTGEEKRVELNSEEAFGPYDESKKIEISKDRLPAEAEPGMMLATEDDTPCVVVDLSETKATIDFNHPFAGKRVVIDVRILDVEVPPVDELQVQQEESVTGAELRV
jgi:FKBP-type peptidyl-prolyl cis-trans isomerase 2